MLKRTVAVTCLLLAGCHHHARTRGPNDVNVDAPPDQQQVVVQQPAPPPQRTVGQEWVDQLASEGYTCTASDSSWSCTTPNDPWVFLVSFTAAEQTFVYLESFQVRAFGHRCDQYTNHMADLAVPGDGFDVTCDDGTQQFRMRTTLNNANGLDIDQWTKNHLDHRANSTALLRKAHALR